MKVDKNQMAVTTLSALNFPSLPLIENFASYCLVALGSISVNIAFISYYNRPKSRQNTNSLKMAAPTARPGGNRSLVTIIKESAIKPVTKKNILFHYSPLVGVVSYSFLSLNVMNPGLVVRYVPKRSVTNFLLFNTLIGSGLYIYNRAHLNAAPVNLRLAYSSFGSVLFTFGSVLLWAVLRSVLPHNTVLCSLIGVSSGIVLIQVGQNYLEFVDSQLQIDGTE